MSLLLFPTCQLSFLSFQNCCSMCDFFICFFTKALMNDTLFQYMHSSGNWSGTSFSYFELLTDRSCYVSFHSITHSNQSLQAINQVFLFLHSNSHHQEGCCGFGCFRLWSLASHHIFHVVLIACTLHILERALCIILDLVASDSGPVALHQVFHAALHQYTL